MGSKFKRGGVLLIPFRDGYTLSDSHDKPRVYKTRRMFEKAFPKHYLGTDGVELVEYAEVVHAHWDDCGTCYDEDGELCFLVQCSRCGRPSRHYTCGDAEPYCHCGAKMDGGMNALD